MSRFNAVKTHCVNGHQFNEANTKIDKHGRRICRECARFWSRRYMQQARAAGKPPGRYPDGWMKEYQANYYLEIKAGIRKPHQTAKRPIPDRILDVLTYDGGWWTVPGLAHRLNCKEATVQRSLCRLRDRGLALSRKFDLTDTVHRVEWKSLVPVDSLT